MSTDPDLHAFERAFVAMSYVLDRRGDELVEPLGAPGVEAEELARALGRPERETRAVVLAREIARIVRALDARRLE